MASGKMRCKNHLILLIRGYFAKYLGPKLTAQPESLENTENRILSFLAR